LLKPKQEEFHPKNKRAAEIAEKMLKARARLAAMQPQSKHKGFLKSYMKIISVGLRYSIEEIINLTIYQADELLKTYMAWEAYDLEVRSRLAGAKGDDKLTHWS